MSLPQILEKYRKNRFLYSALLRNSPCGGAVFGLSLLKLAELLIPFLLLVIFSHGMAELFGKTLLTVIMTVAGIVWLCGLWVFAEGCVGFYRKIFRNFRKSLIFGCLTACFSVYVSMFDWWIYLGILAVLAILKCTEKKRTSLFLTFIPMGILILIIFGTFLWKNELENELIAHKIQLEQLAGHPISVMHYFQREGSGFSVQNEPLLSMIKNPICFTFKDVNSDSQTAEQKLKVIRKRNKKGIDALEKFLKLPVGHVGHTYPDKGTLYDLHLPELKSFYAAANYLSLELAASSNDLTKTKEISRKLIRLRNWALNTNSLKTRQLGVKIESIRLAALVQPIAKGKVHQTDLDELRGDSPSWQKLFTLAAADEAALFETMLNCILMHGEQTFISAFNIKPELLKPYTFLHSCFSHFFMLQILREYDFAISKELKMCNLLNSGKNAVEKIQTARELNRKAKKYGCMLNTLHPNDFSDSFMQYTLVEDQSHLLQTAVKIMEYRRSHNGKLPDDLQDITDRINDRISGAPVVYEKKRKSFTLTLQSRKESLPVYKYSFLFQY